MTHFTLLAFCVSSLTCCLTSCARRLKDQLVEYDKRLEQEGFENSNFLKAVVMWILDADRNGIITRSKLNALQIKADSAEFFEKAQIRANSVPELIEVIFCGFDRSVLKVEPKQQDFLGQLTQALKISDVMNSYNINVLLDEYMPGTRDWMYRKVNSWLDAASSAAADATPRLFLVLAGAGMGKSVFSAVMHTKLFGRANRDSNVMMAQHFFKAGQRQAQGKAMLLSITMQLAEKLPGMAQLLLPVAQEHGDAGQLSLIDTFEKYLLGPLQKLEQQLQASARPLVLFLLDALDEADHGGQRWQPVASLIANDFSKLPSWVRVILTSRPETRPLFDKWNLEWIPPTATENTDDMRVLLRSRLEKLQTMASASDVDAGTELLLKKSEGQFIYTKYIFHDLADRPAWTVGEMERLPSGLEGMYRHIMTTLCDALGAERPELLTLLRGGVLPVLVAARDLLSVASVAWACGAEVHDVVLLARLLTSLFPRRAAGGGDTTIESEIMYSYHKTVLDWLRYEEKMDAKEFKVDVGTGHLLLARASYAKKNKKTSTGAYALRHAVAHACQAGDAELLKETLHDFSMWESIYTAGECVYVCVGGEC